MILFLHTSTSFLSLSRFRSCVEEILEQIERHFNADAHDIIIRNLFLFLNSFGKRSETTAYRTNECVVLEPSEMLVVSILLFFSLSVARLINARIDRSMHMQAKRERLYHLSSAMHMFHVVDFLSFLSIRLIIPILIILLQQISSQ